MCVCVCVIYITKIARIAFDYGILTVKLMLYFIYVSMNVLQWWLMAAVIVLWLSFQMSSPWDEQMKLEQISVVASSMAYMHLSAAAAIEKQFCCQAVPYQRLVSVSAFADFVSCFGVLASKRKQSQLVTVCNFWLNRIKK